MKHRILFSAFVCLVFLYQGASAQASTEMRFSFQLDVFSPIASAFSQPANSYPANSFGFLRLSPEFEFYLPNQGNFSVVGDAEFFKSESSFGDIQFFGSESGKASQAVTLQSFTVGFRKYFRKQPEFGPFAEIQIGYVQERVDTFHRFLTAEPETEDFSERGYLAFRTRLGYQHMLTQHLFLSPSALLDVRRLIQKDAWFRIIIAEINFGILF